MPIALERVPSYGPMKSSFNISQLYCVKAEEKAFLEVRFSAFLFCSSFGGVVDERELQRRQAVGILVSNAIIVALPCRIYSTRSMIRCPPHLELHYNDN